MSDKIYLKEITLPIVETGENETYSFVQTDADLDTAGDAADAKAVGDELTNLKQDLEGLDVYTLGLYPQMEVADTAVASFTDGADDIPVKALTMDIEPVQDLHGQANPYPPGGGKNLFDINSSITLPATISGITFNVVDSVVVMNGTATAEVGANVFMASLESNTAYTVSVTGLNANTRVLLQGFKSGEFLDTVGVLASGTPSLTFNTSTTYDMVKARPTVVNGATVSNFNLYIQVEKGSTATAWSPYSNICPISGWTGANVSVKGVNQWDEVWELGAYNSETGEKETGSGSICSSNHNPCIGGATYYNKANTLRFFYYDGNKNYLGTAVVGSDSTFTVPATARFFTFHVGNMTTYNHDISINYPSTDHDYHAYKGNVYPITFPTEAGTVYGGTLDVTNGVLTVTNGYVDLGTLNWSLNASNVYFLSRYNVSPNEFIKTPTQNSNYANLMCSKYARNTAYNVMNGASGIGCTTDGYLVVVDTNYADATAFKESLSGVQLVYELLEPKTYQLDPTEVATILGKNNIFADTGNINELTYRADLKSYIDSHVGS